MTDLERRALLGDAEAQRECTEKGIMLPCPFCGEKPRENQERFIRQMRDSGALAGVAHSVEEAVEIVFGGEQGGMDKR